MSDALQLAEDLARPAKILVVDDDFFIREMFNRLQARYEIAITCLASPQEAITLLERERYDMVFLDMKFDGPMGGMELIRVINAASYNLHVVIMSGSINLHDVMHEANRLGVLSFMAKPIEFTADFLRIILQRLGVRVNLRRQPTPEPPNQGDLI